MPTGLAGEGSIQRVRRSTVKVKVLCSVRGCGRRLERRTRVWDCPNGHSFDVAASGYVNLLQPGDRRSLKPGDSPRVVAARARLQERFIGTDWQASLVSMVASLSSGDVETVLDVGAGTGHLLGRLASAIPVEGWATDISVPAVRFGSRRWPDLSWVVANGHRNLPFDDEAFAFVLSSVGPKNPQEFHRILTPGGRLLLVVPGPDDLVELRQALQGEGRKMDCTAQALQVFGPLFRLVDRVALRSRRWLDRSELDDLLEATYRGARRAQSQRLAALEGMETTFDVEVLQLEPRQVGAPR